VLTRSSHNGRKSDFPKVIYFVLSKLLNLWGNLSWKFSVSQSL
jgi:hypothetical protein